MYLYPHYFDHGPAVYGTIDKEIHIHHTCISHAIEFGIFCDLLSFIIKVLCYDFKWPIVLVYNVHVLTVHTFISHSFNEA